MKLFDKYIKDFSFKDMSYLFVIGFLIIIFVAKINKQEEQQWEVCHDLIMEVAG